MFQERIFKNQLGSQEQQLLETLTRPSSWDYARFREVLVTLGALGGGQSVPGTNAPESIHLQEWRDSLRDLLNRTKANNREHGRAVFVDTDKRGLVMSGKISIGDNHSVSIDTTRQPGRERFQRIIATIHTHPYSPGSPTTHGLSGGDYIDFLHTQSQQAMLMGYGDSSMLMTLKTSCTPNNMATPDITPRLQKLEDEFIHQGNGRNVVQRVIDFNKMACVEFGLALYSASPQNRDLFERVIVADSELEKIVSK